MSWFNDLMRFFSTDPKYYEIPSPKIRVKPGDTMLKEGILFYIDLKPGSLITTIQDTGSMEPMLDYGMVIILEPVTDINDLIVGDCIVYEKGEGTILHRIKQIFKGDTWSCITRGDRNAYDDPIIVSEKQVKWVLRGVLH